MKKYDIELMHGPVIETEYLGDDKVRYLLDDGREFTITFSMEEGETGKAYLMDILDNDGNRYYDRDELFDENNEGYGTEDYAQFIADNFSWVEELIKSYEEAES